MSEHTKAFIDNLEAATMQTQAKKFKQALRDKMGDVDAKRQELSR